MTPIEDVIAASATIRTIQAQLAEAERKGWNEAIEVAKKMTHPLYQEPLQRLCRPATDGER